MSRARVGSVGTAGEGVPAAHHPQVAAPRSLGVPPHGPVGAGAVLARCARVVREDGPHRVPSPDEAAVVPALIAALRAGSTRATVTAAVRLGLRSVAVPGWTVLASDAEDERSWLVLAVRTGVAPGVLVQVPHPRADSWTERVGWSVARRLPTALVLQAGSHRRAGSPPGAPSGACPADVAHRADSLFALVADALVAVGALPQVQLHGFTDRLGGPDAVVSAGAAAVDPVVDAVAAALGAVGERVGRGDDPACADLAGRTNVQGRSAARHGTAFVHLEMARALRRDPGRRDRVGAAVAAAVTATTRCTGPELSSG